MAHYFRKITRKTSCRAIKSVGIDRSKNMRVTQYAISSKNQTFQEVYDHGKFIMALNQRLNHQKVSLLNMLNIIKVLLVCVIVIIVRMSDVYSTRMIRLCIASVDLTKLSSQCVMCNRREFPLTAIDCTGITKMNDLISNPLSVKEASCLILNCRRQVPNIEPEPYHGSVSHAARVNYASAASGTRSYGIMPPRTSPFSTYDNYLPPSMPQYGDYPSQMQNEASLESPSALSTAGGLVGSHMSSARQQQALPYALVPGSYSSPFGLRKYKAALVPLFK